LSPFEWKLGPMLRYDQPIGQAEPQTPAAGFNVLDLADLLWRRKAAIISAALICACAAVAIGKSLTPRYTATAQLYLDPRDLQLVERELTPRSQDLSSLTMVVESQSRLITSNNVLLQVIHETHLDKDPEFGGAGDSKGFVGSLLGLVGLEPRQSAEQQKAGEVATLEALIRHINIKKPERSFVVDIDVWSNDPAKAALLANAIAKTYLADSGKSQSSAARRATSDLSGRLKELQDRLRNAENALATYKAQNNFVGTADTLVSDQQLSASNQRLSAARALTLDAQAKYDQIEVSRRASGDAGAIPEALQSPTIGNLRAQYAEARKRYAELTSELGPRHPALRQVEQQVADLKRNIAEEIDRFAQSAKSDLARAREYEVSLNNALEAQKRQSMQLSQASVRMRELEREVEASRDVYQSFLKRSRETEEQEGINTVNARISGEATVPQRRTFPPAMSLIAMIGFVFGGLAAAAWIVAADQLLPGPGAATDTQPKAPQPPESRIVAPPHKAPAANPPRQQPAMAPAPAQKPSIALLRESDVMRTLGGILKTGGIPDATRLGWPTLRVSATATDFVRAMGEMRTALASRSADAVPVMAVIGTGPAVERSIAALNMALSAAREGARVLMIDADHEARALSGKVSGFGNAEPSRLGWLSIGSKASRAIKTANGISILPAINGSAAKAADAIDKAIAQARSAGGYDLVILDGPAIPASEPGRGLIEIADGLVAILPMHLDINDCMEDVLDNLGGAERKLIGVVLDELNATFVTRERGKQYA
jgi:polysaccharide biosynthesis transport protein